MSSSSRFSDYIGDWVAGTVGGTYVKLMALFDYVHETIDVLGLTGCVGTAVAQPFDTVKASYLLIKGRGNSLLNCCLGSRALKLTLDV